MAFSTSENVRASESFDPMLKTIATPVDSKEEFSTLPDRPLVVIEPGRGWSALRIRDLWAYRELFLFMIWRDIKVRYKQTIVGFAWVIAQPLFQTLIYTIFFGMLARIPSEGVPYPVFAFAGLLPWIFFARAVGSSAQSVVASSGLITKIYFPRIIVPSAAVASCLVDFAISFCVLVALMAYYGMHPTWAILALPFLVALITLFALAIGVWTSAINVKYRDIGQLLPLVLQVWMYTSPVVYPATFVPPRWHWLMVINPMTGILDGFRAALLGQIGFNWKELALSSAVTVLLLIYSSYAFRRMERTFADIV